MFGIKRKETIVRRQLKTGSKRERTTEWHFSFAEPFHRLFIWVASLWR